MNFPVFPREASTIAALTDHLYYFLIGLSGVVIAVVFGPMVVFLFKYRRGRKAYRKPLQVSTTKIEITWTVIPTLISLGLFAWGAKVYFDEEVPPPNALQINVVAKQWMWKIQHQEGNREINALHIPVNRPVKLTMGSEDVIHSFYVPAFRTKQDVVPGRFTTEWFQPDRVGVYNFYCSEYCGAGHADMRGKIYVMKPADYEKWLKRTQPKDTLAQAGEKLFHEYGCSGCHVNSTAVHAPPLEGVYGHMVPLSDGSFVRADDKYIRDSILLPKSQVVAGYKPVMPTYKGRLTEDELFQVLAYIKSIGDQTPNNK